MARRRHGDGVLDAEEADLEDESDGMPNERLFIRATVQAFAVTREDQRWLLAPRFARASAHGAQRILHACTPRSRRFHRTRTTGDLSALTRLTASPPGSTMPSSCDAELAQTRRAPASRERREFLIC